MFCKVDDFKVQDVRVSDTNLHDQRQMESQKEQVIQHNGSSTQQACKVGKKLMSNDDKVCALNLVQLEDDIGYFKSSCTDLSSSN